jgi:hypothetical protein
VCGLEEGRAVTEPDRPSGGKTLALILLAMLLILAVLVGLAVWASNGA